MHKHRQLPGWFPVFLFPAVLIYYEIIFRISTAGGFPLEGTFYMLLFSLVYSGIAWLIASCSRRKKVNYGLTLGWLILSMAPYLIEYFVYRKFNIYYDLNTCFNGAVDAVTTYIRDLLAMIFSWHGISRIVLFLLPSVLFGIFGLRYATPEKPGLRKQLAAVVLLVLLVLMANLGISRSAILSALCGQEYNFQGVVSSMGLMTGLRLDVKAIFAQDEPESFEAVAVVPPVVVTPPAQPSAPSEEPQDSTVPTEPEVVYTPNVMDLNFDGVPGWANLQEMNAYVSTLTPSMKNAYTGLFEGKNLILITAEAFSAEAIDPELTPTLYRLATKGIQFTDYYQPNSCGTTGGEFQVVMGMAPGKGGSSFLATSRQNNYFTMGSQLDRLGYYGVAYHNNSMTYYDRHKTHNNLGYSEGFVAVGSGLEDHLSASVWPRSDVEMFTATVPTYIDKQPFNVYYMTYSGHATYTRSGNAFSKKHWDRVAHLDCNDVIKGYLASQLEFEDAMTYLVEELEKAGILNDTVICISSDHFPYGLDDGSWNVHNSNLSKFYGYQTTNYIQRDHSRLILWCGILEEMDPIVVDTPTCSVDILPTLSNLFGTEFDSRLMVGRDVFSDAMPLMFNIFHDWKTEYGTYIASEQVFYPADPSVEIPEGYVDAVKTIVRNKLRYCKWVLETDYYRHLFPEQ